MSEQIIPPFVEVDSEMVGLVMAFHARRIMARNAVVEYATNMKSPPILEAMATTDLFALYEDLAILEDAMKTSEDLFEIITLKRIQAEALIERVRYGGLEEEDAKEHVKQAVILQREIEQLVQIMERMAGAS